MKKFEKISGNDLFKKFEKNQISDLNQINGGENTFTGTGLISNGTCTWHAEEWIIGEDVRIFRIGEPDCY